MNLIERAKAFYHRKLDGYTLDEYLIMFVTCSIFLPYFCSIAAIIIVLIYLAFTGRLIRIIRTTPARCSPSSSPGCLSWCRCVMATCWG